MRKDILIGSIIAVVILTLVSFTSVVGYSSVKSNPDNTIITDELDFEYCKDYLFETLVEISDNEDVKDLMNNNNQNLFTTNSNQRTFFHLRRNTNKLSVEHIDFIYNIGLRIIDRIGEDKVAELMETISIDKPDFADELETIIMSNDELKERIYTLNKMNSKEVSIADFEDYPIICFILSIIFVVTLPLLVLVILPVELFLDIYPTFCQIYFIIMSPIYIPLITVWGSSFMLLALFGCIYMGPPNP